MGDSAEFEPMRRWRVALVTALIAIIVLGHLYDIKAQTTHWPFGHYEMFASLSDIDSAQRLELVGVTAGGKEIGLSTAAYSAPLPVSHTEQALVRASLIADPSRRREALKRLGTEYLHRYDVRQGSGEIAGPHLAGLRIYARRWIHVDRWAGNVNTPDINELLFDTGPLPTTTAPAVPPNGEDARR